MKKVFFIMSYALIAVFMVSCSNDEFNDIPDANAGNSSDASAMLYFYSEQEFENAIQVLDDLSISERKEWVRANKGYTTSLQDIYDEAMYAADDIDETAESYLEYKEKYKDYLFFSTYEDDCGAYLPVSNRTIAVLLNKNGEVNIDGIVRNMKDIQTYEQLQAIGVAMYDSDSPETRGSSSWGNVILYHDIEFKEKNKGKEKNVGNEFDTRWWEANKRKIRFKCGRKAKLENEVTRLLSLRLHVEISFRKKTLFGWANYVSKTETEATFKGGLVGTYNWYKNADSSHDFYVPLPPQFVQITTNSGYVRYQNPAISGDVQIDFRGISYLDKIHFSIAALDLNAGIPFL